MPSQEVLPVLEKETHFFIMRCITVVEASLSRQPERMHLDSFSHIV